MEKREIHTGSMETDRGGQIRHGFRSARGNIREDRVFLEQRFAKTQRRLVFQDSCHRDRRMSSR